LLLKAIIKEKKPIYSLEKSESKSMKNKEELLLF